GIVGFALSDDGATLMFPLSGELYLMDRATGQVTALPAAPGYPLDPQLAPGGRAIACVRDGDVHVLDLPPASDAAWRRVTDRGGREAVTNGLAEFVAQEEMGRMHGFWWSPAGDRLLYQETDESGVEEVSIADPTHPETPPTTSRYPRAGKANAVV